MFVVREAQVLVNVRQVLLLVTGTTEVVLGRGWRIVAEGISLSTLGAVVGQLTRTF